MICTRLKSVQQRCTWRRGFSDCAQGSQSPCWPSQHLVLEGGQGPAWLAELRTCRNVIASLADPACVLAAGPVSGLCQSREGATLGANTVLRKAPAQRRGAHGNSKQDARVPVSLFPSAAKTELRPGFCEWPPVG